MGKYPITGKSAIIENIHQCCAFTNLAGCSGSLYIQKYRVIIICNTPGAVLSHNIFPSLDPPRTISATNLVKLVKQFVWDRIA